MKGIVSEIELHTLRGRLIAGVQQKAQRGDLALALPAGLLRQDDGGVVKDPDRAVQHAIGLVFQTFLERRSASQVVRLFRDQGLRLPRRHRNCATVWRSPTVAAVMAILRNPAYAGTFAYGKTQSQVPPGGGRPQQRRQPLYQWKVIVHDRYPAYITWETFERIQAIVDDNYATYEQNTAAGCTEQAVLYWQRAGQQASDRSAHVEAISHLTTGIELLTTLPETPECTRQALTLHIALGAALQRAKGLAAPEVEHAYTQARALCQQVDETLELVPVLFGLWRFYFVRPQLHTARELGETLLRLAQHTHDPALAVVAHQALGLTWFHLGALPAARQHLEEAIARYTPAQRRTPVFRMGQDPGVGCRVGAALPLWFLGYPAQALAHIREALVLAHELSHHFSLAHARCVAANVSQFCRDVPAVHEQAEAAVVLSTQQGFPHWAAWGTSVRGWALAMQGQGEEGLAHVRQGVAAYRATGAALNVPYFCTLLADVSAHLGHTADGL
jgi:tetratricopeptide (TPR) repeat protein